MVSQLTNLRPIPGRRAFSLVEMLVVVSIVALLAAITVPGFSGIVRNYNLTDAGKQVVDALSLARQMAISKNQTVEVRFYKHTSNNNQYDSIVTVVPSNGNTGSSVQWLAKPLYLPTGIVFTTNNTAYSSLITTTSTTTGDTPETVSTDTSPVTPAALQGESYVAFHFRSDGRTDLDPAATQPWCVTLYITGSAAAGTAPAADYVTILLDPVMGRTRLFQPR